MLERMANPDPADEGVDRRYQCLVVFLCEGGHHVTDWVTPNAIRPYLRHAAAYPYKKKAYAGNARLQVPDSVRKVAYVQTISSTSVLLCSAFLFELTRFIGEVQRHVICHRCSTASMQ